MSFEPDKSEHEKTIEQLLRDIVLRLEILIKHNELINEEIITEEDIEDGNT